MRRDTEDAIEPAASQDERTWARPWTPAGVIEVLEPLVSASRQEKMHRVLAARLSTVTVLMDAPHDPHNGGAVLRSCDAFGLQTVHVVPRDEAFLASRKVAKGAQRWVDVIVHASVAAAVEHLHEARFELVATHPEGELTPDGLRQIERLALIVGNEHDGIRDELLGAASRTVRIPMRGFVESLNVGVAAGILLEAATRGRPGDLDPVRQVQLYAQGLYRSVIRAEDILAASRPR